MNDKFPKLVISDFKKLGTDIDVRIVVSDPDSELKARKDLLEVEEIYGRYHGMFSRFEKENDLADLNANLGRFKEVKPEILEMARKCLSYNEETQGYFDPRIIGFLEDCGYGRDFKGLDTSGSGYCGTEKINKPLEEEMRIEGEKILLSRRVDFSGIVKGWITDKVSDFLLEKGWKHFVVDSGGDMYFSGLNEKMEKWTVDVAGIPFEKLTFAFSGMAIATSGIGKRKWEIDGKRYHHLIDPKDPSNFSFDLRSVTVVAQSVEQADIWAKTLFLMGKKKGISYSKGNGIKSLFLDYKGSFWVSPELLKYKE